MKWVTRQFVHVDRTACPWLIKRFIDSKAEFVFAPVHQISDIVEREKAIPYDTLGVELGHHGERCSFDAFIEKYGLTDPALLEVAIIVRAADTDKLASVPEAAGLEAIMTGIGIESKDDYEAIQKAALVYDALYANVKIKNLKNENKATLEKLDRAGQREFLRSKLFSR